MSVRKDGNSIDEIESLFGSRPLIGPDLKKRVFKRSAEQRPAGR